MHSKTQEHKSFDKRVKWVMKQLKELQRIEEMDSKYKNQKLYELEELLNITLTNLAPFNVLKEKIETTITKIKKEKK